MDTIDWTDRKNIREFVKNNNIAFKEAAELGIIEQTILDVQDETDLIVSTLDESSTDIFNKIYAEESHALSLIMEQEFTKIIQDTAAMNEKAADLQLKAIEAEAKSQYTGQIIAAIVIFSFLMFVLYTLK